MNGLAMSGRARRAGSLPAALLLLATSAAPAPAQDGYPHAPFREHPADLARAVALERIELTARAFALPGAAAASEDGDDDDEDEAGLPASALPLFEASLAATQPEVAEALADAVTEMLEAPGDGAQEDGGDPGAAAKALPGLTAQARAALFPAGLFAEVPFQAAVMASLLLDEGGVSESYEEAAEGKADGYRIGREALLRVTALWDGLRAEGAPEAVAEGDAALGRLAELFPAERPARLSPDPEEAEAPAHRLAGAAEVVAKADLYPGRDLGAAAGMVRDLAGEGCAALGANPGRGKELLAIAAGYQDQLLADPLGVMAPETEDEIAGGFEALRAGGAPDCDRLLKALDAARGALAS